MRSALTHWALFVMLLLAPSAQAQKTAMINQPITMPTCVKRDGRRLSLNCPRWMIVHRVLPLEMVQGRDAQLTMRCGNTFVQTARDAHPRLPLRFKSGPSSAQD